MTSAHLLVSHPCKSLSPKPLSTLPQTPTSSSSIDHGTSPLGGPIRNLRRNPMTNMDSPSPGPLPLGRLALVDPMQIPGFLYLHPQYPGQHQTSDSSAAIHRLPYARFCNLSTRFSPPSALPYLLFSSSAPRVRALFLSCQCHPKTDPCHYSILFLINFFLWSNPCRAFTYILEAAATPFQPC